MSINKTYHLITCIALDGFPTLTSTLFFDTHRDRAEFVRNNPQYTYPYYDVNEDVIQVDLQVERGDKNERN